MNKKIFCRIKDVPLTRTRKEFLRQFIEASPTTFDVNGNVECNAHAFRSVTDLHIITKTRFPKTSINTIIKIIGELNKENRCYLIFCNMIKKAVVVPNAYNFNGFMSSNSRTFNYTKIGVDGYSLEEIESIKKKMLNEKD
jgi:hypothetical protein